MFEKISILSDKAKRLIIEAAGDPNCTVMTYHTSGGPHVRVNGINLVEENNPKSAKDWENAVDELLFNGLLEAAEADGEVLSLTRDGSDVANVLREA